MNKFFKITVPLFDSEMAGRLVYARRRMGVSQDQLALMLMVDKTFITRLELLRIKPDEKMRASFTMETFYLVMKSHADYVTLGVGKENYERFKFLGIGEETLKLMEENRKKSLDRLKKGA